MLKTRTWKLSLQQDCSSPRIKQPTIKKATNSTNPCFCLTYNPTQRILSFCHTPLIPFGLQRLGCLLLWATGWLQEVGGCFWPHTEPSQYAQAKRPLLLSAPLLLREL